VGGRPGKTVAMLKGHLTKAELELRRGAEKAMMSGVRMREDPAVKADPVAHAYFLRSRKLMASIGHDDALHEHVINRYCLMLSECQALEKDAARLRAMADDASDAEQVLTLITQALRVDSEIQHKRTMLLAIEKENLMTVASGIRAVPKAPAKDSAPDPMGELLALRVRD